MKFIPTLTKKLLLICLLSVIGIAQAQINTPSGAVVPFGANKTYANGIMPTNLPTGGTYGQAQDAANAYNTWKSFYVQSCGGSPNRYRVKFDDPNKSVSEGIAYGMLLAAYAADKDLFDGLWTYWKAYSTGNGLMNWRVDGGCNGPTQSGSATDSDLDAAYALLIAENQWPSINSPYDYATEANTVINNIKAKDFLSNGQAVNGDGWGTGNTCRNPSYQSPAYYQAFFSKNSDSFWGTTAVNGAYSLLNANADGTTGLVSDWSDNNGNRNLCNSNGAGGPPTDGYGYDACRNPMRMAQDVLWNNSASAKALLNKTAAYLNGRGVNNVGGPVYQNGNNYSGYSVNATFVSTYAMAVMGTSATYQTLLNQLYTKTVNTTDPQQNFTLSGYYGNTLRVLSLFMMSGNMWKLGTTSLQKINVIANGVNQSTNSVYDFQNVGPVSGPTSKAVTFTIQNLGFATLNLSGTPKVSISGANASEFAITQGGVPGSLALSGTANFVVTFTPNSVGSKFAVISIANNDATASPFVLTLTGIGTLNATSPTETVLQNGTVYPNGSTFGFGNTTQSVANTQLFTLTNSGTAPLNITGITVSGASFSLSGAAPTLVPIGGTTTFGVVFTPAAASAYSGTIRIATNDPVNPIYLININGTGVSCGTGISNTGILLDYAANNNLVLDYASTGTYSVVTNPSINNINNGAQVGYFKKTISGNYQNQARFKTCTSAPNLNLTTGWISIQVYSGLPGTPVLMNLKNPGGLTGTYTAVSSITVNTTKTNQWETLYFNHSGAVGNTTINYIELFFDPTGAATGTGFYFDNLKYDNSPCIAYNQNVTSTGTFIDFDNQRNVQLAYNLPAINEVFTNPSIDLVNGSNGVARYIRPAPATYQEIPYQFCQSIDLSAGKTGFSLLVYSPQPGVEVQVDMKNGANATLNATKVSAFTTKTNQWEKLFFDFTQLQGNTTARQFSIFIDPLSLFTTTSAIRTYYIDELKYDSNPCSSNIASSGKLNDYEGNQNISLGFAKPSLNAPAANPVPGGLNTSTGIAIYNRPLASVAYSELIQYKPCGTNFALAPGKSVYSMQIYSPNPSVEVVMQLSINSVTSIISSTVTTGGANSWQTLNFDFNSVVGNTQAALLNIFIDPNNKFGASTYYIDNIQYAAPAPYIQLVQGSSKIPSNTVYSLGTLTSCGTSSTVDFQIQNLGLNDLSLTGTPVVSIGGVNAGDFSVAYATQFANPVSALSASQFTLNFTPTVLGPRSAVVRINSNDASHNPYILYVNGTTNVAIGNTGNIFGLSTVCSNYIGQYYTPSVSGASAYNWTVPSGATITAGQGTSVVTVNWGLSTGGTLSVVPYSSCVTGTSANLTVSVNGAPTASGSVIGLATPCAGTSGTYSIPGVANATGYLWTVPSGSSITGGANTNSIIVSFGVINGNISVSPFSACGTSTGVTPKAITISPAPAAAGAISGLATVCSGITSTYSITPVSGATSYLWNLGNAGGSSTTNSVSVTFPASPGIATLTVSPVFACGNGAPSSQSITINAAPSTPGAISGSNSVCANASGVSYSIGAVSGASSYNWTVPTGASVASGQGTISITANYGSNPGSVNVAAINSCGTTLGTAKAITVNSAPSGVGAIAGNASPCSNTSATYTVSGISGSTSYVWTLPSGSTGTSSANTINVSFGTNNGNIVAKGINACGTVTSAAFAISLSPAPAAAGAITGVTSACSGLTKSYSISSVANATSYVWSVGGTSSISSGQGSTSVNILLSGSGNATVQVVPQFSCGSGTPSNISVNVVPNVTPTISIAAGNLQLCNGQTSTITVSGTNLGTSTNGQYITNNVPGAVTSINTYTFTPVNNNTVSVIATTTGGCFTNPVVTSNTLTYSVSAAQTPAILIGITSGSANSCAADFIKFTAITSAAGTSPTYQWKNGSTTVGTGGNTFGGTNFTNGSAISVVLTSSLVCATQATANSNIIVLNTTATGTAPCVSPVISTILGLTAVNQNDVNIVYSVSSISGALYNWTVPGGATIVSGQGTNSITVNFGITGGNISVAVTNNYGTTTYSQTINILPTDYNDDMSSNEISLYPNPSNGSFNISVGQLIANQVSVEITDSKGVIVFHGDNIKGTNLGNDLSAGHYIVSVITANRVKRLQFLKME